jgi:hypothetical protein
MCITESNSDPGELQRLPGLFRRWELGQVIEVGDEYRIEDAGATVDGTPLFAVYRREPDDSQECRNQAPRFLGAEAA